MLVDFVLSYPAKDLWYPFEVYGTSDEIVWAKARHIVGSFGCEGEYRFNVTGVRDVKEDYYRGFFEAVLVDAGIYALFIHYFGEEYMNSDEYIYWEIAGDEVILNIKNSTSSSEDVVAEELNEKLCGLLDKVQEALVRVGFERYYSIRDVDAVLVVFSRSAPIPLELPEEFNHLIW